MSQERSKENTARRCYDNTTADKRLDGSAVSSFGMNRTKSLGGTHTRKSLDQSKDRKQRRWHDPAVLMGYNFETQKQVTEAEPGRWYD